MRGVFKKLFDILSPRERQQTLLIFFLILIAALIDVIGIASIMPFMAVLSNQDIVENNVHVAKIYHFFDFANTQIFLFFLGVIVFILLIVSQCIKALSSYVQLRFSLMREHTIGKRMLDGYLGQPYSWFLNQNSSDLSSKVLSEVSQVIGSVLLPLIQIISYGAVIVSIVILLLVVDTFLALVVGGVLSLAYGVLYLTMSRRLNKIGRERLEANSRRFNIVSEAFSAIKEIKLASIEPTYSDRFSTVADIYGRNQAAATAIAQLPRYFLEILAFGGILLIVLFLLSQGGELDEALPIIALYAFAGYRLMPAIQQFYAYNTILRSAIPALDALHFDLSAFQKSSTQVRGFQYPSFRKAINLVDIEFNYPGASVSALKDINASISACTTVGFVGATGSGKSTLIDVILGLLEPQKGFLFVDETLIDDSNRRGWQKSIGYVPQQIYLSDNSIAANIAFGVNFSEIDFAAVELAAKLANLHDFVVNELPMGYSTVVGERGMRLSGGQRQRIGIARALYNKPKVLVFDEATSALDNLTEKIIMDAVESLKNSITIIIIAHRLNTVRYCDNIFLLENGRLEGSGTFDELKRANKIFRNMAELEL